MLVQQGPPGCNMSYPICSILYPAAKGFLANYPYQVVFKHLHGKKLQVSSVTIERIGRHNNVKEVMEGLIWLSDHLHVQPSLRFKFKFTGDSRRVVVKIPPIPPKRYLFILPVFEEGSDPNLPFEIGFVGATLRKELVRPGHHQLSTLLAKHPINDFVIVKQGGHRAELTHERVEMIDHNFLKAVAELPTAGDYRLDVKRPFKLISDRTLLEDAEPIARESLVSLIEKVGSAGSSFQEVVDRICTHDLNALSKPQVLELVNKVVLHTKKEPNQEHIGRIIKQLRHGDHAKYVDDLLLSYLTNASLKAIPSVDVLDYLLSLNLLSDVQTEQLLT